jgi:hypothetical protein
MQGILMAFAGSKMNNGKLLAAIAFALGLLTSSAYAYTPDQQQMCSGDAMRLCGEYIPDVDRITACMIRKYSQLSSGCQAVFEAPSPVPAPAPNTTASTAKPGKPLSLTPNMKRS